MIKSVRGVLLGALVAVSATKTMAAESSEAGAAAQLAEYRALIESMKVSERGPFSRIRYFCHDGQVLEPKAYACAAHGGGYQRGEWSASTQRLRAAGYPIANLLVTVDPAKLAGPAADRELLGVLLVERFLVAQDNGWILRRAQYYRGAVQDHNEKEAATTLLKAMAAQPQVFIEFREAARGFPHGADTAGLRRVRDLAAAMNAKDPAFAALRARIHNSPEAGDAGRVRDYASRKPATSPLQADYAVLIAAIDEAYRPRSLSLALAALRRALPASLRPELEPLLAARVAAEAQPAGAMARLQTAAELLVWLRDRAWPAAPVAARLPVADASVTVENAFLMEGTQVLAQLAGASREQRLQALALSTQALYGIGLLTDREAASVVEVLKELEGSKLKLGHYRDSLEYLERVSSWCARRLDYHFGAGVERLRPIEPLADGYAPDRLRASPLLFYSSVLQTLREDADQLGEVGQQLFGKPVASGLRRLNPGLARGVLRTAVARDSAEPAVYLVPATTSDLPPAAGILTEHEGNPVSHVQLLARNLGIPNVVIGDQWLASLRQREGQRVVIAASPGGRIEIADDSPAWDAILGRGQPGSGVSIVPDLVKLDLLRVDFVPTEQLRASDSGRIVGPKAAHVGELAHRFPGHVSPGVAVTFGVFRQLLQQPVRAGGVPMFEWMRAQYTDIAERRLLDPVAHPERVRTTLAFIRDWIAKQPLPPMLLVHLHEAMRSEFGLDGTYGLFVRSDTNIEDLPGFTGAGLNKTLPNVVGFDAVVAALRQVWASPFAERAYGWRQDLMDRPEHVYVSVLLHRTVPNEKSGVMITADVDSGDRSRITVATSAGVGGGVDGDAAESLSIELDGSRARLLASATARMQRAMLRSGGAEMRPTSAPRALLSAGEIAALARFARELPQAYPELRDENGESTAADVEFGFVGGRLMLQQIRPFLQNRSAARQEYLAKMDAGLKRGSDRRVDLQQPPEAGKT